jgi:hypothetical protein
VLFQLSYRAEGRAWPSRRPGSEGEADLAGERVDEGGLALDAAGALADGGGELAGGAVSADICDDFAVLTGHKRYLAVF